MIYQQFIIRVIVCMGIWLFDQLGTLKPLITLIRARK